MKKKLDRHDDHDRKVREGGREITIGAIDSLAQIRAEVITLITEEVSLKDAAAHAGHMD